MKSQAWFVDRENIKDWIYKLSAYEFDTPSEKDIDLVEKLIEDVYDELTGIS